MEVKNSRGKNPTKNPWVEGSMGRLWLSDPLCRDTWFSLSKSANNTEKTGEEGGGAEREPEPS